MCTLLQCEVSILTEVFLSRYSAEMTRLWNLCPDNVEATKQKKRDFVPSLEQYFTKAVEQILTSEEVPDTDR